jgi:2'-5' RNA ligase superfamily
MGPHITLLFPYVHVDALTARELRRLREFFGEMEPPAFRFHGARRFQRYVYLAPEPGTPLRRLMKGLHAKYPQCTPYGGMFCGLRPHLTVAFHQDESVLGNIEKDLAGVNIKAVADRVQVMEYLSGRWRVVEEFCFASRQISAATDLGRVLE